MYREISAPSPSWSATSAPHVSLLKLVTVLTAGLLTKLLYMPEDVQNLSDSQCPFILTSISSVCSNHVLVALSSRVKCSITRINRPEL